MNISRQFLAICDTYWYFDQISLVEEKGNNAAVYKYTEDGLVELVQTPSVTTYKQYDDQHNLIYTLDSQGNGCYYEYSNNVLLSQTTFKYDHEQWSLLQWYLDTDRTKITPSLLKNTIGCTVISKTEYNINTYGLNTSTVSYAAEGNVESATRNGRSPRLITQKVYNLTAGSYLFGRTTSVTDADGKTTNFVYDTRGLLLYEYDGMNHGLYYTYDALGRQTGILPLMYSASVNSYYSQYGAESVSYTYDPRTNRLTQITTATTTYTFTYDAFGNTTSIKAGDSTLVTYTYNQNNGKLLQIQYGTGKTVNYTYDALDRVKEICYNDGTEEEYSDLYTYTADGDVQSVESTGSGRRYDYLYNLKGQVMEMTEYEKDKNGNYVPLIGHLYQYDDLDRPYMQQSIFEYTAADGVTREDFVAYYYEYADYAGTGSATSNVGELTQYEILGAGLSADSAITYGYDELYRMTTKTLSVSSIVSLTAKYEYTNTTQVKSYTSTVSNGVSELENSYSYTYNISGNIIRIVDSNDQAIVYKYDDVGQLVRENNEPLGETYVYTYDNAGNRTSKTTYDYTTDSVDSLTPIETQTYTYSAGAWGDQLSLIQTNGTITAMFSYDAIGNPIVYNGYLMTWDGRRLMTANGFGNEITYAYNSDGLRTRKTVNGVEHVYTLEGSRIVTESWGDNLLIYLYDESGAPIGMQYRTDSYAANRFDTFYFEKNLFGDIVAVYNSMGEKVISYTYDAWGNHTVTWHNSYGTNFNAYYNPFRYRGYYYDTETQLYYLQSRYYNPAWGRFLNADGYLSTGAGLLGYNMYTYCNNNPVMYMDSTGNFPAFLTVALIVAGCAAIGGGLKALSDSTSDKNYENNSANEEKLPEKYIEHQDDHPYMRMGFFGADHNGCGWIATYNMMQAIGNPQKASDVIKHFDQYGNNIMYGLFGASPSAVSSYLNSQGIKYTCYLGFDLNEADEALKNAKTGIVMYMHSGGAHYVNLTWRDSQYNVLNGSPNTATSLDAYMSARKRTPMIIWVIE